MMTCLITAGLVKLKTIDYRRVDDRHVVDIVITPDWTALFGEVHPRVQGVAHLITWCSLLGHPGHYDDLTFSIFGKNLQIQTLNRAKKKKAEIIVSYVELVKDFCS